MRCSAEASAGWQPGSAPLADDADTLRVPLGVRSGGGPPARPATASSRPVSIQDFVDRAPVSAYLWILVGLCFTVALTDGMDVAIMGFVAPPIIANWGISKAAFGVVMSAAPFGLVLGALIAGPAADGLGRRPVLIAAVLAFGVFTILAAGAATPEQLVALRLPAGMGMGAAMPNALTLLSEYAPARRRSVLITVMFTGFNLGSALIGFAAGAMIPNFGWRSVLLTGGVVPLLLVPFLLVLLPESARLLALRGAAPERIARVLARVTGRWPAEDEHLVAAEPVTQTARPAAVLFAGPIIATTLGLWITCFMGLLVIYLLTGWLPTMMKDAGASVREAAWVTATFQVGGTAGAVLVGWVMDRGRPSRVIALAYAGGAAFVLGLSLFGIRSALFAVLVCAAGFCMSGAQTGLNAFAPTRYPTVARATGVSWMLGVGRFGSIAGSALGGALLGAGRTPGVTLALLAVPALIAAVAIGLSARRSVAAPLMP